jgi:hypothetical protein
MLEKFNKKYIESLLKEGDWEDIMNFLFDEIFDSEDYIKLYNYIHAIYDDPSSYYKVTYKELYGSEVTSDLGERKLLESCELDAQDKIAQFTQAIYSICDKTWKIFLENKLSDLPSYKTFTEFCQRNAQVYV